MLKVCDVELVQNILYIYILIGQNTENAYTLIQSVSSVWMINVLLLLQLEKYKSIKQPSNHEKVTY